MAFDALAPIDEHEADVAAAPEDVWDAVLDMLRGTFGGRGTHTFARLLGCQPLDAAGWDQPGVGTTVTGFRVVDAEAPGLVVVEGNHRFSRYGIAFRIEPTGAGARLRIESRGDFPGLHGRLYRLAVIGSRGHVLAVRRMLRDIGSGAERRTPAPSGGTMTG